MPPLPQVTRGFIARYSDENLKGKTFTVKVGIYSLGCFIAVYQNDELLTHTSRTGKNCLERTNAFVEKHKSTLKYPAEIEELGIHKVKTDRDGFYISSL